MDSNIANEEHKGAKHESPTLTALVMGKTRSWKANGLMKGVSGKIEQPVTIKIDVVAQAESKLNSQMQEETKEKQSQSAPQTIPAIEAQSKDKSKKTRFIFGDLNERIAERKKELEQRLALEKILEKSIVESYPHMGERKQDSLKSKFFYERPRKCFGKARRMSEPDLYVN